VVQRQYTGTAGRIENSQVAVYLTYASSKGHPPDRPGPLSTGVLDRRPRPVARDRRSRGRHVRDEVGSGQELISAALDASVLARWATGDEVYDGDPKLRQHLHGRGLGYVLAIAKNHQIRTGIGTRRAIDLAVRLPPRCWQRLSAGRGAKGERWYDWALIDTTDPTVGGHHWLLIRRNRSTGKYAFYRAFSPTPSRSRPWSQSPAAAGASKNRSPPLRSSLPWTSTRSEPGRPGSAGALWRS
jgi:hypothetical protein